MYFICIDHTWQYAYWFWKTETASRLDLELECDSSAFWVMILKLRQKKIAFVWREKLTGFCWMQKVIRSVALK